MSKKLFTQEQAEYIINNYQTVTDVELAQNLGNQFKPYQITHWRKYHGYKRDKNINAIFSEKDITFMKNHYKDMSYKEIGEILGYTERQIRGKINGLGLTKNRQINDHYFNDIDTPMKAYLLGFIFADGWIVYNEDRKNYEFGMELQSSDKYILEKLNQVLGNQNIIKHIEPSDVIIEGKVAHSGHSDVLRVFSKKLVLGLMKNGIDTNKTQKDTHPNVSNEFFFDWLRGYIDGDGCYWKYKNHYYMHITCASEKVLKYVKNRLQSFNIETRLYKENNKKFRLMCVNQKEMKKLINNLYPNTAVFCLKRKLEKVKEYL